MNKSEHLKKELISSLRSNLGVVSSACSALQVSRTTYYKYYKTDEQFKEQVDSISDEAIDFVESQLFELIRKGNVAATIFFLKTKGKKRGYVERQELDIQEVERPTIIQLVAYGEDKVEEDKAEVL